MFGRGRAAANQKVIDRLNACVVEAVRAPAFYQSGEVPDTFNGRFELLVLHVSLVVRRMRALQAPGPAAAQDLVDTVFRYLDPALRELGVGDMGVPKRMKRLAENFLGRAMAYDAALSKPDDEALADALRRNVYGGTRPADDLAAYVRSADATLQGLQLAGFLEQPLTFPDPNSFLKTRVA